MSKVKVLGWSAGCKPLKTDTALEQASLRASNSLMARLLVIARFSRELDVEEVIGTYELSTTNQQLMTGDWQTASMSRQSTTHFSSISRTSSISSIWEHKCSYF